MRKLAKLLTVGVFTIGLNTAFAALDPGLAKKMQLCFEKHGKLMEKPAIRNMYDCYRAHGYLMNK